MIGVAVIGYGYWGPNVVRNFRSLPDCELRMVCDSDAGRLHDIARIYPEVKVTTEVADVLCNPAIDAISICTPVSTHHPIARACLKSGRHVLIEKPMADSLSGAIELMELANARRLVLNVDFPFVHCGAVQTIRSLIDDGAIGELLYFDSVRVNLGLFKSDVNVLWDLAAHDLSIMSYLIRRRPVWVSAVGSAHYGRQANLAYLTVMYDDALIAHVHVNWLSPVKLRSTLIGGDRQMIVYDDLAPSEKVRIYAKGVVIDDGINVDRAGLQVGYRMGDVHIPHIDRREPLNAVCDAFLCSIRSGTTSNTDGAMGVEVVRVLEAAQQSLDANGNRVRL